MPSAASDHAALSLNAIHLIAFRNASVRLSTSAIPRQIHVVAAPDLVLSLSGTHDRAEIPAKVMAQSHIANHLVQYLRTVIPPAQPSVSAIVTLGFDRTLPS
jgi:hypothetical protein